MTGDGLNAVPARATGDPDDAPLSGASLNADEFLAIVQAAISEPQSKEESA